jgi:hypothetical protein
MSNRLRVLITIGAMLLLGPVMFQHSRALAAESDAFIFRMEALFDRPDPDCAALVDNAMAIIPIVRSIRAAVPSLDDAALEQALTAAVRQRLLRECAGIARSRTPGSTVIMASRPGTDGQIVTTRREGPSQTSPQIVVWRLVRGGPWGWRVSDIRAEGRGLVATLVGDATGSLNAAPGDPDAAIRAIAR